MDDNDYQLSKFQQILGFKILSLSWTLLYIINLNDLAWSEFMAGQPLLFT